MALLVWKRAITVKQRSVIGSKMHNKRSGFTLIEILVVIFIISVIALAATMNFSTHGNAREIDNESYRLKQIVNLVAETAVLEQADLGVGMWRTGYAVWRFDPIDKQWKIINHDRILTAHTVSNALHLTLRIEKMVQILPEFPNTVRGPQLWFSSSGSALPAVVSVTNGEVTEDLIIENNGAVTVQREE
jgi:type II secretion system protein H